MAEFLTLRARQDSRMNTLRVELNIDFEKSFSLLRDGNRCLTCNGWDRYEENAPSFAEHR